MINAVLRTIRDSVATYMTHTTRWLVAAHYPGPLPDEDSTDRINNTSPPTCSTAGAPLNGAERSIDPERRAA